MSRPRPWSSQSYEKASKDRIKIQVIEQTAARGPGSENESAQLSHRRTRSTNLPGDRSLIDSAAAVPLTVKRSYEDPQSHGRPLPAPEAVRAGSRSPSSQTRRLSRPAWVRTTSGGVWYQRKQGTSSQDNSSTRSARSVLSRSDHSEPKIIHVSPLKPPARPERPVPESVHEIKVEKAFGDSDNLEKASTASSNLSETAKRQMSTFDVRRLFSSPFLAFRRAAKSNSQPSPTPIYTEATLTPETKTHKTLLRRDQTSMLLCRVSSLLEAPSLWSSRSRLRTWTHKSVSTTSSSEVASSKLDAHRAVCASSSVIKKDSLEHVPETTSSILRLHMGTTPQNSPSEYATYKVKRSPSVASEEFLKIDISIRGGTSYLPSEARRIHTPPLPEPGQKGLRRGFFFDYNPPFLDEHECKDQPLEAVPQSSTSPIDVVTSPCAEEGPSKYASTKLALPTRTVSACRPRSSSKSVPRPHYPKTGDWYDTKLADIDSKISTEDFMQPRNEHDKQHSCKRHECQENIAEIRRREYEAQLDYSIPEHLPSSPLCPRNPRYWRKVKGKGSQFRGCWMHGHGEWKLDEIPGLSVKRWTDHQ